MSGSQSPYTAAAGVPLIKSPSVRVPKLVTVPPTIHPLPENVTAYFVYPYTLEPHVVQLEANRQATFIGHQQRQEAFFKAREQEKERRRKEALRKVAPGFEPEAGTLVPQRVTQISPVPSSTSSQSNAVGFGGSGSIAGFPASVPNPNPTGLPPPLIPRDPMADLVDQLAKLDANKAGNSGGSLL